MTNKEQFAAADVTHWLHDGRSLCGIDAAPSSPNHRFVAVDVPYAQQATGWRVDCHECIRQRAVNDARFDAARKDEAGG